MTHEQLKTYESQLKPCPFCGSKARLNNSFGWFTARCTAKISNCDVFPETMACRTIEEVIKLWNTRSAESKVLEDIRAEIAQKINENISMVDGVPNEYAYCYSDALDIIDKHIKGVNNK